ncbi:uncharacterized protein LOC100901644 [Galendromus occidentalis]|uniref:Uncharacterized protein LOC100901644 n=1 Tax=Galendromus occidentalis TaxID=34638 RepID=A0AAJ6VZM7_9ACAR|nr:uncharacterized protein LOC100901644 [Galendromus occidentalis]
MAKRSSDVCLLLILVLSVAANASDFEENYVKNLESFARTNLTFECVPFMEHNQVPECDCSACASTRPNFFEKVCEFRATQDPLPIRRRSESDPKNDWDNACKVQGCTRPTECCDPRVGVLVENGCPKCMPTVDARTRSGAHASCQIADRYSVSSSSDKEWKQLYKHYDDAMIQAKVSKKCLSYAVARTANPCDCVPCLESESSIRTLREKLCEMGRVVRTNSDLNRRDFWGHNDYFLNFCNFDKCPEMPRRCCEAPNDSEASRLTYPVDAQGCPSCLPTSSLFGFGPGCNSKIGKFSRANRDRVMKILENFAH